MKLGVSIKPVFGEAKDLQEFFESLFVKEAGFDHIEVHTNDLDVLEAALLETVEKTGVKFSIHCPHMFSDEKVNFCSADKGDIAKADEWFRKSIEYGKKLKAKNIVIHPDQNINCSKEEALKLFDKHIRDHLGLLGKGQRILIENMPGDMYPLSLAGEFGEFLIGFDERVGVCWDIGHEIVRKQKQEFDFPRVLEEKIKEVHISGLRKKGGKFSDHFSLVGGDLHLDECIGELKKIKFKGPIIFEVVTKNPMDIIESKKVIEKFI